MPKVVPSCLGRRPIHFHTRISVGTHYRSRLLHPGLCCGLRGVTVGRRSAAEGAATDRAGRGALSARSGVGAERRIHDQFLRCPERVRTVEIGRMNDITGAGAQVLRSTTIRTASAPRSADTTRNTRGAYRRSPRIAYTYMSLRSRSRKQPPSSVQTNSRRHARRQRLCRMPRRLQK